MLHNSLPFEKKFTSDNKSNRLISGNVDNYEKLNIH